MPTILHTADWQLGLPLRRLTGDRGAHAREARFRVVERIAERAHALGVDAVVVAGDVFDDNQVSPRVVQRARDALARFAPLPVLLLPGNHDAAEPGGVLARLVGDRAALAHVHVLLEREPVTVAGMVFHPCPLFTRLSADDPTRDLPARDPADTAVRVAIAHGGAHGFGSTTDVANLIDVEAIVAKGFDYVALGDWHGRKRILDRAWYPGAPEPTRFKEQDPGHVLVVELPEPGATPRVQAEAVALTTWLEPEPFVLHGGADVDALHAFLDGLPDRSHTLVRLHLKGALSVDERARLDALLQQHADELLSLQVRTDAVATALGADDLARLDAPGFLGEALAALADVDDRVHQDAARLLYRMVAEATS
ncbi:MAG: DNA repair exonuclease [Alphaproteobacteria bacterium]|nr:DNA repair exonuclease [Alphaproteobacteria bacterium]